jgi:Zn-dependent peptidase ImmA (M78 family)/transcriptional regulator with XRE-family HTH domain
MPSSPGKILAELRDNAGVSIPALARAVNVSENTIASFEQTDRGLSIGAAERIARYFAVSSEDWLRGNLTANESPRLFQNRRGPRDLVDNENQFLSAALIQARSLRELNDLLQDAENIRTRLRPEAVSGVPYQDGYRLARRVRSLLGNESEPLSNLGRLLGRSFSIFVAKAVFRPAIRAVALKDRHGNAAILLNRDNQGITNYAWQRVNMAHELCHILFDDLTDGLDVVVDWGEEAPAPEEDGLPTEQRARAFAAELLIPQVGLRARLGAPRPATSERAALVRVRQIRDYFQTTYEVALYHLVNQGYVSSSLKEPLQRRWADESNASQQRERIDPLWKRAQDAWSRGLITSMRARELLGLSPWAALPWEGSREAGHAASS